MPCVISNLFLAYTINEMKWKYTIYYIIFFHIQMHIERKQPHATFYQHNCLYLPIVIDKKVDQCILGCKREVTTNRNFIVK